MSPIHQKYTKHCVKDSFTFADEIKKLDLDERNLFMCSYDIKSLYTNIPLNAVIEICCKAMYEDTEITPPPFSCEIFKEFLKFATCSIEFSFN